MTYDPQYDDLNNITVWDKETDTVSLPAPQISYIDWCNRECRRLGQRWYKVVRRPDGTCAIVRK